MFYSFSIIQKGFIMELLVNNVQKSYAKVTAIKSLSFKVNQGEIFALLGPNGSFPDPVEMAMEPPCVPPAPVDI